MDIANLTAETRESTGKGAARSLRREGKVPGILYGSDIGNIKLSVDNHKLEKMFNDPKYSRGLINLEVTGGEPYKKTVMIKELQIDPVKSHYIHLDLYEIKMDQKISVMVPVVITGEARGVEDGGTLQVIRRELEVYCLPRNIPESIEIDVSDMEMGESLHVSEIVPGDDLEIPYDADFTVVTVVSPMRETVAEEEVAEGEEGLEGEEAEGAGEEEAGGGEE